MLIDNKINIIDDVFLKSIQSNGAIFLIDKSLSWTSFDVVAKMRNIIKMKKIGHAGTLDPLASGLLIVCTGKFTKTINTFQEQKKVYTGEIKLGATTKTDDSEADEENICEVNINIDDILNAKQNFIGSITQIPPKFSARKINGQRQYVLARKNIEFEANPTQVEVYSFEIINYDSNVISFRIECSKGTYIRAIARDLGQILGCGAYLKSLRRTSIGDYNVENALTINQLIEIIQKNENI